MCSPASPAPRADREGAGGGKGRRGPDPVRHHQHHHLLRVLTGLPVLGRDYQDILTLAPGVTDVNNTGNPNIHGARDTDVVTLVDGVNTTDPSPASTARS